MSRALESPLPTSSATEAPTPPGGAQAPPAARAPEDAASNSPWVGLGALVIVQVCYGLFPVFGSLAMAPGTGFAPFSVAIWRIVVGAVILLALAAILHPRDVVPARRDLLPLAVLALLGIVLNQGLFLTGLERSTPMNAGLVICLIPVFSYAIAVMARYERFAPRRGLGVAVAVAGSIPLFLSRGGDLSSQYATGNALMACNAFCYSLYMVGSKPLLRRMPAFVLVAWVYVLSVPWLPFFLGDPLVPAEASAGAWWSLVYVLVFPTIIAYALNSFALARVEASTAAFFIFAQPIVTATASWFLLGERPTVALLVAGAGLLGGMALVLRRPAPSARVRAVSPAE